MYDRLPRALFICSAVTCILLRVWIKLTLIDPTTGFYSEPSALVTFFNGFLLVAAVGLFLLPLLKRPPADAQLSVAWESLWVRITGFLCAIGAWTTAGFATLDLWDIIASTFNFGATADVMTEWAFGFLLRTLVFVIAPAISGWLWLQLAVHPASSDQPRHPYLFLVPVLWQCSIAIYYFMRFTSIRHASDKQLFVAVAVLAVPFLLAHAWLASGIDRMRGMRQVRMFGYLFALLALVASAGAIAALPAGRATLEGMPPSLTLLFYPALGIHALSLLFLVRVEK